MLLNLDVDALSPPAMLNTWVQIFSMRADSEVNLIPYYEGIARLSIKTSPNRSIYGYLSVC